MAHFYSITHTLLGPSGSGKTTVFRLILGYLKDYKGEILYNNTSQRLINPTSMKNQIAYIEQEVFLFNETIKQNITLGNEFNEEELSLILEQSALDSEIARFEDGLDTVVGENGCNLSGGQKQRIAIARALIHHRSIILVDEGTSALDKKNAEIVENCLLKNSEITLILISHNLPDFQRKKFDAIYSI